VLVFAFDLSGRSFGGIFTGSLVKNIVSIFDIIYLCLGGINIVFKASTQLWELIHNAYY